MIPTRFKARIDVSIRERLRGLFASIWCGECGHPVPKDRIFASCLYSHCPCDTKHFGDKVRVVLSHYGVEWWKDPVPEFLKSEAGTRERLKTIE